MGSVYLAHDSTLDRAVALKVSRFTVAEAQASERFLREARAAAGVQHPGICPVYDFGQCDGLHYITMSYMSGRPLSYLLQGGKAFAQERAATIVRRAAEALDAAHRHGVVHRDLKPSNILLDEHDFPRIVDFGLARRSGDPPMTRAGEIMGTPAFMSPEQIEGSPVTPASDIYSLGVVLYHLLTGRVPFEGSSLSEIAEKVVHEPPPPPSQLKPKLDRRLEAICLKALAKSPEDRYRTMGDLAAVLNALHLKRTTLDWRVVLPISASLLGLAVAAVLLSAWFHQARPQASPPTPSIGARPTAP
jgi:serine/threonine-protein kinase